MAIRLQTKVAQDTLSARTSTALRIVVALSLAAACIMVFAQPHGASLDAGEASAVDPAKRDLDQLERLFWICDHAASTEGVTGVEGIACGEATEQVRVRKFGGNFEAMLVWWRENKGAMQQALGGPKMRPVSDSPAKGRVRNQDTAVRQGHANSPLETLSEPRLKSLYLTCSRAASRQLLASTEIGFCSVVYETLLTRVFGGDFHALLAWSKRHPDGAGGAGATPRPGNVRVP
jgi:hypothetical protein